MKKNIIKIISLSFIIFTIFSFGLVFASMDLESKLAVDEYSEEYEQWLQLSDEEKENTIEPRKYDIEMQKDNQTYLKELNNVFRVQKLLRATISADYNLKDVIPENVTIKNQMSTNSCWAFATIGMLESHLALKDKNDSDPTVTYDFSERHMNYATAKSAFLNNATNEYGYTKKLSDGGNIFLATQYMANGLGVINESDMPFVDSEENIDISEIQNQEVQATLYDTVEFPVTDVSERAEIMPQIKEHIVNYGGIYAGIHGANILSDSYNNKTGAIYCTNPMTDPLDHTVVIIGWDDNYSVENFKETQRPTENGAWIIKNSWGQELSEKLSTIKQDMFEQQQAYCESMGWDTADKIPDDIILNTYKASYGEDKVSIQGENLVVEMGNKGYMYVSYEDCNVYQTLIGIEKATNTKDYEKVYQNDTLGASVNIIFNGMDTLNLANVYKRDTTQTEYLDKISIYTFQGYTCKVLVNPNGSSKAKEDLQEIQLTSGETDTFEPGYHTIEFAEPIALTGDSFVVVVQIVNDNARKEFALEKPIANTMWQDAVYNEGESFCATANDLENNIWTDLATVGDEQLKGNLCIKAYTTSEMPEEPEQQRTLTQIYIQNQPTKTEYVEGEDFDRTGMMVVAQYSDGSTQEITNYTIIGVDNLTVNTTTVTIQYTEDGVTKTVTQPITVKEAEQTPNPDNPGEETPEEPENPDNPGEETPEEPENPNNPGEETPEEPENPNNPGGETPEQPEDSQEKPVSSDFTNVQSVITESKLYFSSDDLSEESSENTIKISGIKIGDESNTYTYYYYVSGTQGDDNITDWTKTEAVQESDGTYSITLKLKSGELQNYTKIAESDNLYVYIREVAEVNQQSAEQIVTLEVDNQVEPECYIDGVMVGGIDDVLNYNSSNNSNNTNNTNQNKDNTVASGILPYAGGFTFKIIVVVLILAFGGFAYYRYKNIDR